MDMCVCVYCVCFGLATFSLATDTIFHFQYVYSTIVLFYYTYSTNEFFVRFGLYTFCLSVPFGSVHITVAIAVDIIGSLSFY